MENYQEQVGAAHTLVDRALAIINIRYGENGLTPLGYHNPLHTRLVLGAGTLITELAVLNGNFDESLAPAAEVAEGYHDVVQEMGSGVNEGESIVEMFAAVRRLGRRAPTLSDRLAEQAAQYMAATVVYLDERGRLRQSALDDYGEMIMADADLATLGDQSHVFWPQVQGLFRELHGDDADRQTQLDFLTRSQVPLLEHHQFYTPEAQQLFPHQERNLASIVHVRDLLERDDEAHERFLYLPYDQNWQLFIPTK